jgi:hypothetical protein
MANEFKVKNGLKFADGTTQTTAATGGGTSITISTTAPSSPTAGELWWNSETGLLSIYYNDGSSSQWVSAASGPQGPQGPAGAAGSNFTLLDTQTYSTGGSTPTWTKPANAKLVYIVCVGASGGAAANTSYGGTGGGSGGAICTQWISASLLGGTEAVTVGLGGAGGNAVSFTAAGSNGGVVGNPGQAGGDTSFGGWIKAEGGNPGTINTSNAALGGAGAAIGILAGYTIPLEIGGAGADATATDNNPAATSPATATFAMPSGGGSGGAVGASTGVINGVAGGAAGSVAGGSSGAGYYSFCNW